MTTRVDQLLAQLVELAEADIDVDDPEGRRLLEAVAFLSPAERSEFLQRAEQARADADRRSRIAHRHAAACQEAIMRAPPGTSPEASLLELFAPEELARLYAKHGLKVGPRGEPVLADDDS